MWELQGPTRLLSNGNYFDRLIEPVRSEVISFYEDGIMELDAGIFMVSPKEWPEYRYPWIYCGNFTYYRLFGKFLEIYHPGKKTWLRLEIQGVDEETMKLASTDVSVTLRRLKSPASPGRKIRMKRIELTLTDSRYSISRKLIYEENDHLRILELNPNSNSKVVIRKLPDGYFAYLQRIVARNDAFNLSKNYNEVLDGRMTTLELVAGSKKKTIRSEGHHPDNLTLILVALIYSEDLLNYPDLWFRVNFDRYYR